jgi:hypothetical protein
MREINPNPQSGSWSEKQCKLTLSRVNRAVVRAAKKHGLTTEWLGQFCVRISKPGYETSLVVQPTLGQVRFNGPEAEAPPELRVLPRHIKDWTWGMRNRGLERDRRAVADIELTGRRPRTWGD